MRTIYVIGAQCTGKTTLVDALSSWLRHHASYVSFVTLKETARTTLKQYHFTRDDVRAGGQKCLQLQKLIFQSQLEKEKECSDADLVISDRSAVDPLVYAIMYCDEKSVREMLESDKWKMLRSEMREDIIIVCEPVEEWLFDDGVRLVPKDREEWIATHQLFCTILHQQQIPYVVLPASTPQLDERVEFVLTTAGIEIGGKIGKAESPR